MENKENRSGFFEYQGKQILLLDLSGCNPAEIIKRVGEIIPLVRSQEQKSTLMLTDVSDMTYDKDSIEVAKEFTKGNEPFVKKSALVGVQGLKKIGLQTLLTVSGRNNLKAFDTTVEAQDWLVSDE